MLRRFVFVGDLVAVPDKAPIQMDLFAPRDYRFAHKVKLTKDSASDHVQASSHPGFRADRQGAPRACPQGSAAHPAPGQADIINERRGGG